MRAFIAELQRYAEQARSYKQTASESAALAQTARERLSPLEDRLARLLSTIPLEVQQDGLSLSSLQVMLRGRWRGNAHAGQIGTALRRLGWTRQRSWRGSAAGFSAHWYPPGVYQRPTL